MNTKYLKVVRRIWGRAAILIIAWGIACACNETDAAEETIAAQTLCEGGSELWIGYQRLVGMGGGGTGFTLFEENGYVYFVIDESCRYFAFDGTDGVAEYNGLADIRTGVLTKDEAADIANRLKMPRWPDLFGNRYYHEALDCGSSAIFDKTGAFSCDCDCPSFSAPSGIDDVAEEITSELVAKGSPLDGPLRAVSIRYVENCDNGEYFLLNEEIVQSPLVSYDPAQIAVPDCSISHDNATQSVLIDGEAAVDLRTLRRTYREQLSSAENGRVTTDRLLMQDRDNADDIYQIFLRDYIPLEDKDGLLQPHDLSALKTIEP